MIRLVDKLAAFHPADQGPPLGTTAFQPSDQDLSPGTPALKGHGFSRAASRRRELPGFSPRGTISSIVCIPSAAKAGNILEAFAVRLKPCPFKTSHARRNLVRPKPCPFKTSLVYQNFMRLKPCPFKTSPVYQNFMRLEPCPFNAPRFTQPLRSPFVWTFLVCALAALLAATPSRADAPAAPTTSHQRDSSLQEYRNHLLALTTLVEACAKARNTKTCDAAQVGDDDRVQIGASSDRRLVRYGWLRVLLSEAQDKDKPAADSGAKPEKSEREVVGIPPSGLPTPTTSELLQAAEARLAHDLAQTDKSAAPAPAHPAERDAMRQVLAGRDFRNLQDTSLRDKLWEKLGAWLNRILESISRVTPRSPWVGRIVFWGFILGVSIALVWGLLQLERRWRIRLIPEMTGPGAGAASARDWQLWLQDARQAAASGLWREAIHYLYWASISRLESRRLWPADRARTPREYLALVAPEDPRKPGLASLTGSFERFWYGGRSAAQSDYLKAEELATALISGSGASGGSAQ